MIGAIEASLVALCNLCLLDDPSDPNSGRTVNVSSGPWEYDGSFLKRFVSELPAVRVVWEGGEAQNATDFTLSAEFSVIVMTGWRGGTEESRRIGTNMAYSIIGRLVPGLHRVKLRKDIDDPSSELLTLVQVEGVGNLGSGEDDRLGVAVYEISLSCEIPLDIQPAQFKAALDDWLRAGVDFDLPDEGEAVDLSGDFDLPQ